MTKYVSIHDEATIVAKIIKDNLSKCDLTGLITDVLLNEPRNILQFPCILCYKTGSSESGLVGDNLGDGTMGRIATSTIQISIMTRKNIKRTYNNQTYKDENLVKLLREGVRQIMFDNKEYSSSEYPRKRFFINEAVGDIESTGFRRYSSVLELVLTYSLVAEEVML